MVPNLFLLKIGDFVLFGAVRIVRIERRDFVEGFKDAYPFDVNRSLDLALFVLFRLSFFVCLTLIFFLF